MSRLLFVLAPGLALVLFAGCIAPEAIPQDEATSAAAPPPDRIEGMTVDAQKDDKIVPCGGSNSTLDLPTGCAERRVEAEGRIGVETLAVHLMGMNGPITIKATEDDSWSFTAVVRVQALTAEDAKKGLDTAWSWSHEESEKHALRAGPNMSVPLLSASVISARYEVELPEWVVVSLDAKTSNGPIMIEGLTTDALDATTSNGPVHVEAMVKDAMLRTSNGPITGELVPTATGKIDATTSNGPITLDLVEDPARGYDIEATTSNGRVTLRLDDGEANVEGDHGTFKTNGYDARAIQTTLRATTSNGAIVIEG